MTKTKENGQKKLLLMGQSGSGKSSMRSLIFSNYLPLETHRLRATIDVEHSNVKFLGKLPLTLWDCGGQDGFFENYFGKERDNIFRQAEVLVYVFDVESREVDKDIRTFTQCLKNLREFSRSCKVFVLLHKMDLVNAQLRDEVFSKTMDRLTGYSRSYGLSLTGFPTSIWDESLYRAWSAVVGSLIPNISAYQRLLQQLADISDASEIVLFEKTTLLSICHVTGPNQLLSFAGEHLESKRFEKISNIVKTYKQSCTRLRSPLKRIDLHGVHCNAYIDQLTRNAFFMVVVPPSTDPHRVDGATIMANIKASKDLFDQIEL